MKVKLFRSYQDEILCPYSEILAGHSGICFQIPVFPQVLFNYHDENECPYSENLTELSGMCFQIRQVLFAQVLCIFWPAAESPARRRGRAPRCLDSHVILKEHIPTYLRDLFNVIVQSFALMASYQYC